MNFDNIFILQNMFYGWNSWDFCLQNAQSDTSGPAYCGFNYWWGIEASRPGECGEGVAPVYGLLLDAGVERLPADHRVPAHRCVCMKKQVLLQIIITVLQSATGLSVRCGVAPACGGPGGVAGEGGGAGQVPPALQGLQHRPGAVVRDWVALRSIL